MHFLGFYFVYRQARIQTGFHRFTEIGQIFHTKHKLITIVELSKLKSGKWSTCKNVFRALDRNRGKGTFACPRASLEACSLGPSFRKSVSIYPRSASDRDYSVSLTEHLYKTDLMVKRTPRVGPYLSFLPLFD